MIAKICGFVICISAALILSAGCGSAPAGTEAKSPNATYDAPKVIGQIRSADITESSGIASSKCQKNVLWTHNDSGDEAFIYAIDPSGNSLGTWKVPNVKNIDWEDIALVKTAGKCYIYIGEIGDNKTKRPEHNVFRVPEPSVAAADSDSSRQSPLTTADADILNFSYPDANQDAESLLVHPISGEVYVVTKRVSGPAGIYRLKPDFNKQTIQKAEKIGELSVPAIPNGFLTGGDISPDGKRVIICDYTQAYEYVLPDGEKDFETVWKQTPESIDLGKRKGGESVCYSADGLSIFATSEGRNSPMIEIKHRTGK